MASEDDASFSAESDSSNDEDGNRKPAAVPAEPVRSSGRMATNRKRRTFDMSAFEAAQHEPLWDIPDSAGIRAYQGPEIDFHALANRHWGTDSTFQLLPVPEIDSLVGWATHVTHNGRQNDDDSNKNGEAKTKESAAQDYNPLIGIQPDAPLPPSYLEALIHTPARNIAPRRRRGPFPGVPTAELGPYQSTLGQFDTSALVAMGMILEDAMTANLLPLAEYHVQRCRALEEQEEDYEQQPQARDDEGLPPNYERESFHQWTLPPEEAIFNVMMSSVSSSRQPKAEAEVKANPRNTDAPERVNTPFFRIDAKTCRGLLPTARPPKLALLHATNTATTTTTTSAASHTKNTKTSQSMDHDTTRTENAVDKWCQRQDLRRKLVHKNMDLFHWFLPAAPSRTPEGPIRIYKNPHRARKKPPPQNNGVGAQKKKTATGKRKAPPAGGKKKPTTPKRMASTPSVVARAPVETSAQNADDEPENDFFSMLSKNLLPPSADNDDDDGDSDDDDDIMNVPNSHEV